MTVNLMFVTSTGMISGVDQAIGRGHFYFHIFILVFMHVTARPQSPMTEFSALNKEIALTLLFQIISFISTLSSLSPVIFFNIYCKNHHK